MADEKKPANKLNIELPEEIAEGVFSNFAIVGHSPTEFVIDFIRTIPNAPNARVKARVIITPEHAKRFLAAFADNINKYEANYGTITGPNNSGGNQAPPMNFNTPTAHA